MFLLWCRGEKVYIINTKLGDKVVVSNTDTVVSNFTENPDEKGKQYITNS